ncbi:type II toxin-antitoxin system CcdA family antitoxin [Dryocola sp. BD586]|uniref:type II toxin-antitoxin system CcdA family antitoxin n=1 Tax=Dryocola sp. BD586 TaxID=3133271 RepID=UPI003F4F84EE
MPGKREREVNPSSQPADALLLNHKKDRALEWYEENKEGIAALNEFVEKNGSFNDLQRPF